MDGQGLNQGQCIARGIKTEAHDEFLSRCLMNDLKSFFSNSCIVIVLSEQTLFFSLTVFR